MNVDSSMSYHIKIISPPRLGSTSSYQTVRSISNHNSSFFIAGSTDPEFSIEIGDKIYFAPFCSQTLPVTNSAHQTELLDLLNVSASGSTKVQIPSTLTAQTAS